MNLDQKIDDACQQLATMPESEFQSLISGEPSEEQLRAEQEKANRACDARNSWFEALLNAILPR